MSTQQIAREAVRPQGESQEEYEARRKAEVDAILERSHVTRDSIENGGAVEFQNPNFIADRESFERNPELAKALLDDVMPWEEPGFVASLKSKEKAATDEANVLPPTALADEDAFVQFDGPTEPLIPVTTDAVIMAEHVDEETGSIEMIIDQLRQTEEEYIQKFNAETAVEAVYKARLQDFNNQNAELLNTKKEAAKSRLEAEERLQNLLVAFAKATGEKKFDEYLSVKEFTEYDIDEAAATTWAETNYPAAINKITNFKLLTDYLKTAKQNFGWAIRRTVYKPMISKKFVQTAVPSQEVNA
jgi:hypothetical protein